MLCGIAGTYFILWLKLECIILFQNIQTPIIFFMQEVYLSPKKKTGRGVNVNFAHMLTKSC